MEALDQHKKTLNYHRREMQKLTTESANILETLGTIPSSQKLFKLSDGPKNIKSRNIRLSIENRTEEKRATPK